MHFIDILATGVVAVMIGSAGFLLVLAIAVILDDWSDKD